jgi:hypothetical protein
VSNETFPLNIKLESHSYQDFFISSSTEEISTDEAYADILANFRRKLFFGYQNISPIIKYDLSSKFPLLRFDEIETVPTSELFSRIAKIKALDDVFGMLNDLSPKQKKIFEKAIKRRRFFK